MRIEFAQQVAKSADDDLLSTGEAAKLLGASRQHVVNICLVGDLPFTLVGTHRRLRRSDVERLRSGTQRRTRDQLRSLLFAYAVAGHVVADPEPALRLARRNLEHLRSAGARGAARVWLDEWEELLDAPLPDLLEALTSPSPRSRELRQNSPFAGVLSEEEREQVLAVSRRMAGRE